MKPLSMRMQLAFVGASYAFVLAFAVALVAQRYWLYVNHPEEAAAAGGMYAFGDSLLALFIGCLLLVPTFLLVVVIRKSESLYTKYAKILLGLAVTAPICLGVFSIPAVSQSNMLLGEICLYRLLTGPIAIVGMAVSRVLARFERAKRLTSYALLIELLTMGIMLGLFLMSLRGGRS